MYSRLILVVCIIIFSVIVVQYVGLLASNFDRYITQYAANFWGFGKYGLALVNLFFSVFVSQDMKLVFVVKRKNHQNNDALTLLIVIEDFGKN